MFDVRVDRSGEPLVAVSGSVDLYSADELAGRLRREVLQTRSASLGVDLTGVGFLSFEGLAVLVSTHAFARRRGTNVRVLGAHGQPLELLELSGLARLLLEDVARGARR